MTAAIIYTVKKAFQKKILDVICILLFKNKNETKSMLEKKLEFSVCNQNSTIIISLLFFTFWHLNRY